MLRESLFFELIVFSMSSTGLPSIGQARAQENEFPFPSFWPTFFIYGQRTPLEFFAGDELELVSVLKNENNISTSITLIMQILDSKGVASAIAETESVIFSADETVRLVSNWRPEERGTYLIEAFVLAELHTDERSTFYLLTEKWTTDINVRANEYADTHDLRIQMHVDNPGNVTAGTLKGTVELVNESNQSRLIKIQPDGSIGLWRKGIPRQPLPVINGCEFWQGGKLEYVDSIELAAHGRIQLNEGDAIELPYSLDHADSYELTWYANLLVQEPNGVNCVYVASNEVSFNVTAPLYERVSLVLIADKETYKKGDTVRFESYIENSRDVPFQLTGEEIEIHILDGNGRNLLWISSTVADATPTIISPHTNYTLDNISPTGPWYWDWDQRNYTPEGVPFAVGTGEFLAYATFSSPPMKSEMIRIVIE